MDEIDDFLYEPQLFSKIAIAAEQLADIINSDMGTRIGQSTVCSQKMHTVHPKKPQEVNVLQDIDAGQTFYHREESGSVYHLDIFHECGLVDHHMAALEVYKAIEVYNAHYSRYMDNHSNCHVQADFFDIQTGTGGGRITGSLEYGKKLSLRKGHTNHVHITMALPQKHLACVLYVVMAAESAILSCNLELRCNEKIENVKGASKGKIDLSAYADKSDSLLQKNNSREILDPYQKNQDEITSFDKLEESQELKGFSAPVDNNTNSPRPTGGVNSRRAADCIAQKAIIALNEDSVTLTNYGQEAKNYLEKYLPEIEVHLRKVVREAKYLFTQTGKSKPLQNKISRQAGPKLLNYIKVGHELGELALSETVNAAARRMVEKGESLFEINHEDFRYSVNRQRRKIEFCVLIDASSSMKGPRIRAAKLIAQFLFLSTADRISVIAFRENKAWVQVPFTRDLKQLERRLEEIKAEGETPLALGLTACLQYLEKKKVCNPLIIVITDGVPTVGTMTSDPVHDALQVAKRIKTKKYGFTCIGLKPHLDYLQQLAEVAGGTIYVVDDLEQEGMC